MEHPYKGKGTSPQKLRHGILNSRIPPASAPLEKTLEAESTSDYFGNLSPRPTHSGSVSSIADSTPKVGTKTPDQKTPPQPTPLPSLAYAQDMGPLFAKTGWLAAPIPPDEIARRRALYRFNILHSAPDINFDRIAHMAKLVFSPKIVLIALIDSDTQWHKAQSGLGSDEAARISSFCSHSVLGK